MPTPPTVIGQQDEDFQRLLDQLGGLFERLRQQNGDLTRENLELRATAFQPGAAAASGDDRKPNTLAPPTPIRRSSVRHSSLHSASGNTLAMHIFRRLDQQHSGRLGVEDLAILFQEADEPFDHEVLAEAVQVLAGSNKSADSESNGGPTVDCVSFSRLLGEPRSWEHCPPDVEKCLLALRKVCWQSSVWWQNSRPSKTITRFNKADSICSGTSARSTHLNLLSQFRNLDEHGSGRLYLEDLVRILRRNDEHFEYDDLICAVQVLNGDKPKRDLDKLEDLSLDFAAFSVLMDEAHTFEGTDAEVAHCIICMRKACDHDTQAHSPRSNTEICREEFERESIWSGQFWSEIIPTFVILLNLLLTGLSTDLKGKDFQLVWELFEYAFASFYTFEFVVKLRQQRLKGYFCGADKPWNIFDFVCLVLSLTEILVTLMFHILRDSAGDSQESTHDVSQLQLLRILRLCRLARIIRTLRFKILHELKLMVFGVFSGLRVLSWAIILLFLLIYVVAVITTNLMSDDVDEFGSMPQSMSTLFRCWTDGCEDYDGKPLPEKLRREFGRFSGTLFVLSYMMISTFVIVGVFNLIMAIFIENVVSSHAVQRQKELGDKARDFEMRLKDSIASFLNIKHARSGAASRNAAMGGHREWRAITAEWERLRSHNLEITRERFNSWLDDNTFHSLLTEAEIDTANKFQLFDVLDVDQGGHLSLDELTQGLMRLRGPITKADIVAVRLMVRHLIMDLEEKTAKNLAVGDHPDNMGKAI